MKGAETLIPGIDGFLRFIEKKSERLAEFRSYFERRSIPSAYFSDAIPMNLELGKKYWPAIGVFRAVYSDHFPDRLTSDEKEMPNYGEVTIQVFTDSRKEFDLVNRFRGNMPFTKYRKLEIIG